MNTAQTPSVRNSSYSEMMYDAQAKRESLEWQAILIFLGAEQVQTFRGLSNYILAPLAELKRKTMAECMCLLSDKKCENPAKRPSQTRAYLIRRRRSSKIEQVSDYRL